MISINGPEGGPGVRLGISLADLGAGVFAALGVVSALYERRASGMGRLVDIGMLDAQTMLLESALVRQFANGETQRATGSRHPVITPFDVFHAQDAPIAIACANDHLFAELCAALGKPSLATDPDYASLFARFTNHAALKVEIENALASRTATEWVGALQAAGVPCAPVQDMAVVARDPQLTARSMFVEVDDPEMGKLRMAGNAMKISGFPDSPTRPPAPNLDEARADILGELGLAPEAQRPRTREGPKDPAW
jgi:CoA:oxalate CoA-transferase